MEAPSNQSVQILTLSDCSAEVNLHGIDYIISIHPMEETVKIILEEKYTGTYWKN